jgi:hypothetical protein
MWRPSERWRSGWDGEFESPLLQRGVCEPSVPRRRIGEEHDLGRPLFDEAKTYLPDAAQLRNGGVGRNEIDVVMG